MREPQAQQRRWQEEEEQEEEEQQEEQEEQEQEEETTPPRTVTVQGQWTCRRRLLQLLVQALLQLRVRLRRACAGERGV